MSSATRAPEPLTDVSTWLNRQQDRLRSFNERLGLRRAGWGALVAGTGSLVAGLVWGWREVTLAGALAVALVGIGLLFTIGRPMLRVDLEIPEHSVVVGSPLWGELRVRNTGPRRHFGSRMDLPIGGETASFTVPGLGAGRDELVQFRVPTRHRGVIRLGPARSVQGDPFALTGRETKWTGTAEVYVHPVTVTWPGGQAGFVHDLDGQASQVLSASDLNFRALRPYVAGDDRRHVHWRSSARAGELLIRQFDESRRSRVALLFDTSRTAWIDAEEFELGVSCVGSIAVQALRSGSSLALSTPQERLMAVSAPRVLDELSGVERGPGLDLTDVARHATRLAAEASAILIVTGSSAPMDEVRKACSIFGADLRCVGIRIEEDAVLRVRSGGSVAVAQIGSLRDLPRAMRRVAE
ncbi:MAG: DUF58 domain-containing protein [Arachnia sp.]